MTINKRNMIFTILAIILFIAATPFAQGLRYDPPQIEGYEFPFPDKYYSPLAGGSGAILKNEGKMFSDTAFIDFEGRRLTFKTIDSAGNSVWTYHYGELNEFISDGKLYSFYGNWYNSLSEKQKRDLNVAPPAPKLEWELAVHYPPWAQRLLGNAPPKLKIEGRLEVTVAFDYRKMTIGEEETVDIIPFDVITNYAFSIRGSVGRLISVNISVTKQDGFDLGEDPLKNFKVEYKEQEPGELEDEIIQEVVIGYTDFSMPGTNLSGYSDKHDGLFGVKVRAKVGPLMLTGIASHAQGEAMTRELGGKSDQFNVTTIREDQFLQNRYFFLDTVYKNYYNEINNISAPNRAAPRPPRVTNFQAFVSIGCNETVNNSQRRYKANLEGSQACFRMLTENQDYTLDADNGWIRFEHNINNDNVIAITMTSSDPGRVPNRGTFVPLATPNDEVVDIVMLKPSNMEGMELERLKTENPDMAVLFGLMWRNVYHMPEIEDGKLTLFFFDPAVGDTLEHNSKGTLFSRVLGITDDQGRARLETPSVFNMERNELIIPPFERGEHGNEPFRNPDLDVINTTIYEFGSRTTTMMMNYTSRFGMLTNGSAKKDTYDDLGWNILPGTVTVKTKSGTLLIEDEDYFLDYQMGILDLISARAKAAESILITYQRESDFVMEKKVFAGLRGELKLPFISENSFMAASVLYQDVATSAGDVPMLGNEPFSKLHLSFNTSLDFEPEWMTKLVNKIPLVTADEEATSKAKIDFEVVHSRMNPNTAKDNGAYLDDFERTKDGFSLSLRHQSWHPSHFPFHYNAPGGTDPEDWSAAISEAMLKDGRIPAWDTYWFTPNAYDNSRKISRFEIWIPDDNDRRYGSSDTYVDVLRWHTRPAPAGERWTATPISDRFTNAYSSITTSFGRSGLNMENHRYIELIIKPNVDSLLYKNNNGKLKIQIGTFSHDQVRSGGPPNGVFDLEDPTYQNKPDQLSMYDWGLDGIRNLDEKFYMIPNASATAWEKISRNENSEWLFPPLSQNNPSGDLYSRYDRDNVREFRMANGTRGNSQFDSENIDNDGFPRINIKERYIEYEIDLDDADDIYIDKSARLRDGWRLYRIPISIFKDSGSNPDKSKVRGARFVWTDFHSQQLTREHQLFIAGVELVGNYWEPDSSSEGKIEATSIGNYDDQYYYDKVHNYIVKPKSGEQTPQEHSLRLEYKGLNSGDTALVWKNMGNNSQNISGYDSLTVKVFSTTANNQDENRFVLRLGADSSTFYEYNVKLINPTTGERGWHHLKFRLQDFTDFKLYKEGYSGGFDTSIVDPNNANVRIRIKAQAGRRPSFTQIAYMAIGVARDPGGLDSGVIWVNELIATSPRKQNGMAARLNIATQWADFLSLSAGASYTEGSFRKMTDPVFGTEDRSELTANVSATMNLNKFMPEDWGIRMPVGGSISGALSRPMVKPQSDITFDDDDGLMDMAGDAWDLMRGRGLNSGSSNSQRFQTFTTTRNAFTSFEKESESENPFVNFTLDRITAEVGYSQTASYTGKGHCDSTVVGCDPDNPEYDYFRTDTVTTYTGNLRYDLSPRDPPKWTSGQPLDSVKWVPSLYWKYKFNLLPSTISFDVAEVRHTTERRDDAKLNIHDVTTRQFDLNHGVQIEYAPIDPLLTFGYGLKWRRDVSDLPVTTDWELMRDSTFSNIFGLNRTEGQKWDRYNILYGERERMQSATARFAPQIVKWMTHSAEYNVDYAGRLVNKDLDTIQYMNASVNTSLRLKTSLLFGDQHMKGGNRRRHHRRGKGQDSLAADSTAAKDSTLAADSTVTDKRKRKRERKPDEPTGLIGMINRGAARINMKSINAEYEANTNLRNDYLSSTFLADTADIDSYEYLKYQLGMGRSIGDYFWGRQGRYGLGNMFYRENLGSEHDYYRNDQAMGSWSTRFSTAFSILDTARRINISNVSVGWGREFYSQPDTAFVDTTIVLPDIRVSANTALLGKFSLVAKHLTRLTLNSSFNYKRMRKETRDRTDTTMTIEFMPLVGLDGKFKKWPALTATYRYGTSNTMISTGSKGDSAAHLSTEENRKHSHAFNIAYEFTPAGKLQQIKIRKWVIPIKGKTTVGMTVNWDTNRREYMTIGEEDAVVTKDSEFNYSPYINYTFTDNIKGQARYLGVHKNQDGMRTLQQRFALTLEVKF